MPRFAFVLAAAFLVGCGPAQSQDRAATILANLRHEFPQLQGMEASVDSLAPSGVAGLDRGVLTMQGQSQPFLVTEDGTRLYLLAADAVDVSRSPEALAAADRARDAAAVAEASARGRALAAATAGLPSRGPANAPVTIVEFSDFQCPYCRMAAETVETVLARYPDAVRLVYAHFPLGMHPWAEPAAVAATCAGQQSPDAFWALHDAYFEGQAATTVTNVTDRSRTALAATGIDLAAWAACTSGTEATAAVREQVALGEANGVSGTPGFFINGRFLNGNQPIEAFVAAIEAAQAAQ
ncbi:MAG TPA: thioredoxin domain-containing protein [Rubricoccaceae bacterium]|jgi:protein-disulfide isomerase